MFYKIIYRKAYTPDDSSLDDRIEELKNIVDTFAATGDIVSGIVVEPNQTLVFVIMEREPNKLMSPVNDYNVISANIYEPQQELDEQIGA